MKLQVALDEVTLSEGINLIHQIENDVDIIEVGTPLVIREGMSAVRQFKQRFPTKEILADEKIVDGGAFEANLGFEAGADYVTVVSITDNLTIQSCIQAANARGKKTVVDLIGCPDLATRVSELEKMGAHMLSVHTGADQQAVGRRPLADLKVVQQFASNIALSVAGGINSQTIGSYVALKPEVVIVGSGICKAANPAQVAHAIKQSLN